MKFFKIALAVLLAITMAGSIACAPVVNKDGNNSENQKVEHTLTLHLNGGTIAGETSTDVVTRKFEEGKTYELPKPTKSENVFRGWYENAGFTGYSYDEISSSQTKSDKEFWAKWEETSTTNPPSGGEEQNPPSGGGEQNPPSGGGEQTQTYNITYVLNEGTLPAGYPTKYTKGVELTLPIPTKTNFDFGGWFEQSNFSGSAVVTIPATATGDKTYYAKWDFVQSGEPTQTTYDIDYVLNGGTLPAGYPTKYTKGVGLTLPIPTKPDSDFGGWFEQSNFSGSAVVKIPATATGDKTYYAKWNAVAVNDLTIKQFGGYEEGAYVLLDPVSGVADNGYKVEYRTSGGAAAWTAIDSQLIRKNKLGEIRADIVGIKAGSYDIKVTAGSKSATETNVAVTAYDRSGYAHFKASAGVGGYNADGTPKSNAVIIYVTDATKNTVTAKIGSKTYTGLVSILQNAKSDSTPVIVRILDTITTKTWKKGIDYKEKYKPGDNNKYNLTADQIVDKNGKQIPTSSSKLNQSDITTKGYNDLQDEYTLLEGLTSRMSLSGNEWDSYWNMCDIDGAKSVTVEGIGTEAGLFQWGFTWKNSNSIEVRNLTFDDYTEDACSFEGSSDKNSADEFDSKRIWLHHNTFLEGMNYWDVSAEQDKHDGDGSTDFKRCSYVTVSYNHYYNNHKTGLVGGNDSNKTANITFHHNYYDLAWSRLPLGRQANMHMYNNYYKAGGQTSYFISVRATAFVFVENCYFDTTAHGANIIDTYKETEFSSSKKLGYAKLYNCMWNGSALTASNFKITQQWAVTAGFIKVVSGRTEALNAVTYNNINNGNCQFGQNFDTDTSKFYYDGAKSNVTEMLAPAQVKDKIPQIAGVHKN